jgi:hypothetical protein
MENRKCEYEILLNDVTKLRRKVCQSRYQVISSIDSVLEELDQFLEQDEELGSEIFTEQIQNLYPTIMNKEPLRTI